MSCKFLGSFHTPPTLCRCLETLFMTFEINNRFQITKSVGGIALSQDGVCTDFFENFSVNSWKRDLSIDTTFNPPLSSLVNTFRSLPGDKSLYLCNEFNIRADTHEFHVFIQKPPPPFCSWPSIFETNTRNRDCRIFKPNSILHTRTPPSLTLFPSYKIEIFILLRDFI